MFLILQNEKKKIKIEQLKTLMIYMVLIISITLCSDNSYVLSRFEMSLENATLIMYLHYLDVIRMGHFLQFGMGNLFLWAIYKVNNSWFLYSVLTFL